MQPRIDTKHIKPEAYKAMLGLQAYVDATGLEQSLRYLSDALRRSMDAHFACTCTCAMRAKPASRRSVSTSLPSGANHRCSPPASGPRWHGPRPWWLTAMCPMASVKLVRAEFSEQELVDLTMAVVAINGWNRMMVSFRILPAAVRHD